MLDSVGDGLRIADIHTHCLVLRCVEKGTNSLEKGTNSDSESNSYSTKTR